MNKQDLLFVMVFRTQKMPSMWSVEEKSLDLGGGKAMNRKRFKAEEIVNKLPEVYVLLSEGMTVTQACKQIGVTGFMYHATKVCGNARYRMGP